MRATVVGLALTLGACSGGSRDVAVDTRGNASALDRAYVVPGAGDAPAVAYVEIRNGSVGDTLTAVRIDGHDAMVHDAQMQMLMAVPVAASATVRLAPGGLHAMFTMSGRALARGDTVRMELVFARGGVQHITAHVIDYADVDTATAPRPGN